MMLGAFVSLDEALSAYQTALENLDAAKAENCVSAVESVMLARHSLAQTLAGSALLDPGTLGRVMELDARLKTNAACIAEAVGPSMFASWRETIQPSASAWWWFLDQRAEATSAKTNLAWTLLAGACLTIFFSLAAEVARRFLSGGPDFLGVWSTIVQCLLALVAGSSFTQAGREWIGSALSALGIQRKSNDTWKAGLALTALLAVVVLRLSLPAIARFYSDNGFRLRQAGRLTSSLESYQRAISLNPDYAQTHYNLGHAYEDVLEYDKAMSEYQRAIEADAKFYAPYNNLARLYILRRGEQGGALKLLDAALNLKPQDALIRYSLHKNRGWANFELGYLGQAEADLQQARELRGDGAAAHCLLAKVFEARTKPEPAAEEWRACVAYSAGQENDLEAAWLSLAQERLSPSRTK